MAGDKLLERRLERFYAHVPLVPDALPLKDYLLKHGDNQMAWYLLGKMYENRGEYGKASYCYRQAGTVYEAYENRPAPPSVGLSPAGQAGRRRRGRRAAAVLALLAIAAWAFVAGGERNGWEPPGAGDGWTAPFRPAPGVLWQAGAPDGGPSAAKGMGHDAAAPEPDGRPDRTSMAGDPGGMDGFAAVAGLTEKGTAPADWLADLLRRPAADAPSLVVRAPRLGTWIDWVESGAPIATVKAGAQPGTAVWTWLDPAWCGGCPVGGGVDRARVEAWKSLQEYKLALRAAMLAYRERTGRWPEAPEALTGAYPHNTMAGWTPEMGDWFAALRAELAHRTDGQRPAAGWPGDSGPVAGRGRPLGAFAPLAAERPEIIVDKTNHRLAVVAGNVLLRNYEVGLGGNRTPEGTFTITEKVRNPNGHPDGEYGSRGLVLSGSAYAIHGTDDPDSIGKDDSMGCIRMAKEDLEELYDLMPLGTRVTILKKGLPAELRVPPERFRLAPVRDETNPGRVYRWLD